VQLGAVAAKGLGAVQRLVGGGVEVARRPHGVVPRRDADARADRDAVAPDLDGRVGKQRAQLVGGRDGRGAGGLGQQHDELLAAVAPDDVRDARGVADALCGLAQHRIPGRVAVGVVDELEVIDVEQQARERPGMPGGQCDGLMGARVELATVEEPGQPVARGALGQPVVDGPGAQCRAHTRHELLVGERLDDVVDGAGVEARHARVGVRVRGQEDHRRRRRALRLDRPADLVAVAAGHGDVDEQEVGLALTGELERGIPVGGGDDLIPGALEPGAHDRARDAVVVGDEDERRLEVRGHHSRLSTPPCGP
jgi:hypothetical protein